MAADTLNASQPVNQQIYHILRKDIVECHIAPGTLLSEKDVSVRFEVSRQPVREAFIKLAENGFIQIRPQRGSYVNKISIHQVINGCFVREAIERAVVRRAIARVDDSKLWRLEQNIQQQRSAVARHQLNDFFVLDNKFHQLLAQIADCNLAWDTVENIKSAMDRVRYINPGHITTPNLLLEQHNAIFDALVQRDTTAADAAMLHHLHDIREAILIIHQENSDWFTQE